MINDKDPYWKHTILRIIEWASEIWGGFQTIIIPTNGKIIDECFWAILERYSPDYIYKYNQTVEDLRYADPKKYEEILARERKALEKHKPSIDDEEIDRYMQEYIYRGSLKKFEFDKALQDELKYRLAPFHFEEHVIQNKLSVLGGHAFPETQIADIINYTDEKTYFSYELGENTPLSTKLLIYSVIGKINSSYHKALESNGIEVISVPDQLPLDILVKSTVDGQIAISDLNFYHALEDALENKEHKKIQVDPTVFQNTPFKKSLLKLGLYHMVTEHRDWEEPVILVAGNTLADFCLYYCLSRLHENVFLLPDGRNSALRKAVVRMILNKISYGHSDKEVHVTSVSFRDKQLSNEIEKLKKYNLIRGVWNPVSIEKGIKEFTKCVYYINEQDNYDVEQTLTFVDGTSVGRLKTPKPKNFSYIDPTKHRWITDVKIDNMMLPPVYFMHNYLISLSSGHESRLSKYGLSYLCPNIGFWGGDVDTNIVKPKVFLPKTLDFVRKLFQEQGFEGVTLSDKGNYTSRIIQKFGSLDDVVKFFKDEKNYTLLGKFYEEKSKKEKGGAEVVNISTNEKRSYINFDVIKGILGSEKDTENFIDTFTKKQLLYRGYILKCEECKHDEWYPLGKVSETYECTRCGTRQALVHSSWREPSEPPLYYKIDEVFRLFYSSNLYVDILTLGKIKETSKESFIYTPELEISNSALKKEIDFLCIPDGKLVLGECKSGTIKDEEITKWQHFLNELKIYPDTVLFSFMSEGCSADKKVKLDNIKNAKIWLRKDLFND